MSANEKAEALFADISQFVEQSHALLRQGAVMELSGLDGQVSRLCQEVLALPQDARIQYAEDLQRLLLELKTLGEALAMQRDAVAGEIRGLSQHRKASKAYLVSDAADGFGKKSEE